MLKRTSIAWTHDGLLVLLAQADGRKVVVGVWRPGTDSFALKTVEFPDRTAGSDSFSPIS